MGRKDEVWTNRTGGYIETTKPTGYDVLINGIDRYLNFNTVSGFTGYGFRDNGGVMEVKNSGGGWTPVGTGAGTVTSVTGTSPIVVNNTNPAAPVITIQQANTSQGGYLSSTDWNTFNNKQAALGFTPENVANKATDFSTVNNTLYPTVQAAKTYADGLVAGLLDYRGGYDASGNVFPSSGGSGTAGAVLKGDMWVISVAGTLGGNAVQVGDSIIANIDTPGQTSANWNTLNTNITYVPEDVANKVTSISGASTNTQYPSAKLLFDQLALKQATITPAALTKVDDTNVTLTLGGTPATALLQAASLTLGWTGQLSMARGGTGANLVDPNADTLTGWDDTDGAIKFITIGSGLTYTHATHTLSASGVGGGTVTSVASADGSITVTNPTTTADLAVVKAPKWSTARNLAGNSVDGSANVAFANKFIVQGTADAGLSAAQFLGALATGIVKNTTTTGVLSIAVAADFPTLNQNTTGSAATLTTPRTIGGVSFNGSANITVASATGGFAVSGGDLTMGTNKITGLGDPTNAQDAATKNYVDSVAQGLSVKGSVLVATAAALPTNTYLAGVITITATGTLTVDGVVTALNDRILVKDEASQLKNGVYKVTTAGAIGVAAVLTRSTDMDVAAEFPGAFVFVESGTVNTAAGFVCTNSTPPTVGTTAITFTQFSGAGEIIAGNGLSKSGNTLTIDTSITVDKTTAQTLTNKTLTTPIIASLYQDAGATKLLTLPATTDTLVGKATTDTFTNKTMAASSNVLGGVTMTLGSDADGDMYYRASSVLTRLPKGTTLQQLRMNAGATAPEWFTSAAASTSFTVQDIPLKGNSSVTPSRLAIATNSTGSVLFIVWIDTGSTTTVNISRFIKDSSTAAYYETHTTTLTVSSQGLFGAAVIGSFLYVQCSIASTGALRRYAIADLIGVTTMTISGTNALNNGGMGFTDGTSYYAWNGTAGTFQIYSISGTTATAGSTVAYTTSGNPNIGAVSDGTNVYITDATTSALNIRKYPLAGGAATSTTAITIHPDAWLGGNLTIGNELFMAGTGLLGIGWNFNWVSDLAVVGLGCHVIAITAP